MEFANWIYQELLGQPITAQQAIAMLQSHQGVVLQEGVRTDLLQNHQGQIYYNPQFPTSEFGRRGQGWDAVHVLKIINQIFTKLDLPPANDIRTIDKQQIQSYLPQIQSQIPPIIVSKLPDDSNHLDDGNHRLGVAKVLGLPALKAFVLE